MRAARSQRLDGLTNYTSASRRGTRILKQFCTEIFSSRRPHFGHVVEKTKGTTDIPTLLRRWRDPAAPAAPAPNLIPRKEAARRRPFITHLSPFYPPGA